MLLHIVNYTVFAWALVALVKNLWRGSEFEKLWKRYKK